MSKELPCNTEAETWLLGGVFQDPRIMAQFASLLEPGDFYLEKHRLVWAAMQSLQKDGRPIDILTVGTELREKPEFQSLFGSSDYLFGLMESVVSAANADYYVELVAKAASLRKLISASKRIIGEAFEADADPDILLPLAIERIADIASKSSRSEDEHIADISQRVLDHIKDRIAKGLPMGAETGFAGLDGLTGGLRPGELAIAAARTGMGKTSFAMSVALHVSKSMPVKFFSLEVKEKQLAPRAMSFLSHINMQRTLNAKISGIEIEQQQASIDKLRSHNIYADFNVHDVQKIISESHAFAHRRGKGLVIIDHLHFIRTGDKKHENRNIEIGSITRAIKGLAGDIDMPVLLLSQLNRGSDMDKSKKPKLSDLRDSGNIEQDADMVWFLNRSSEDITDATLTVAKNRSGPTGETKLYFDISTTRFHEAGKINF